MKEKDFLDELIEERTRANPDFPKLLPPLKCKVHPKYEGKRRPRAACEQCHYIWEKNQR